MLPLPIIGLEFVRHELQEEAVVISPGAVLAKLLKPRGDPLVVGAQGEVLHQAACRSPALEVDVKARILELFVVTHELGQLGEAADPGSEIDRRPVLLLREGHRLLKVRKEAIPEVVLGGNALKLARNQPDASKVVRFHRRDAEVEDIVVELREDHAGVDHAARRRGHGTASLSRRRYST